MHPFCVFPILAGGFFLLGDRAVEETDGQVSVALCSSQDATFYQMSIGIASCASGSRYLSGGPTGPGSAGADPRTCCKAGAIYGRLGAVAALSERRNLGHHSPLFEILSAGKPVFLKKSEIFPARPPTEMADQRSSVSSHQTNGLRSQSSDPRVRIPDRGLCGPERATAMGTFWLKVAGIALVLTQA